MKQRPGETDREYSRRLVDRARFAARVAMLMAVVSIAFAILGLVLDLVLGHA